MTIKKTLNKYAYGIIYIILALSLLGIFPLVYDNISYYLGGGNKITWELIANNVTSYTIPDDNNTYKVIVKANRTIYMIINTTGYYDNYINGNSSTAGFYATIIDTNATFTKLSETTSGFTGAVKIYQYNGIIHADFMSTEYYKNKQYKINNITGITEIEVYKKSIDKGLNLIGDISLAWIPAILISFSAVLLLIKGLYIIVRL